MTERSAAEDLIWVDGLGRQVPKPVEEVQEVTNEPVDAKYFEGKTIKKMVAVDCNEIVFDFTDGTRMALHIECSGGLPSVQMCNTCIDDPDAQKAASWKDYRQTELEIWQEGHARIDDICKSLGIVNKNKIK